MKEDRQADSKIHSGRGVRVRMREQRRETETEKRGVQRAHCQDWTPITPPHPPTPTPVSLPETTGESSLTSCGLHEAFRAMCMPVSVLCMSVCVCVLCGYEQRNRQGVSTSALALSTAS